MKKTRIIILTVVFAAMIAALGCLTVVFTMGSIQRDVVMLSYLEPYETEAADYLRQNQEFTALYGTDVTLNGRNITCSYTDPKKYTALSLNPQIPASAEEFEAEAESLTVSFNLPDLRVVNVNFAKTPEGGLEITGWEYEEE